MKFLTIDDFDLKGKTVFLRVDMNCPIDPETLEISGTKRIEEIVETINSLNNANCDCVTSGKSWQQRLHWNGKTC